MTTPTTTRREPPAMQDHELDARLGHVTATPTQRTQLRTALKAIEKRYPRDREAQGAAFSAATSVILGDDTLRGCAAKLQDARKREREAMRALSGAVIVAAEDLTEMEIHGTTGLAPTTIHHQP